LGLLIINNQIKLNKMANKEKEIELKPKLEKISEEHLAELKKLVNAVNGFNFNIGRVEVQKHELLHKLALTQDNIALFQDKLMKEYGSFDVNVNDGTINWPKEPTQNGVEKPKEDEK
tara:strand:- start:28 stop:378 length:351 start_codon:yes stop_codon:yes gene_type:complete